MGGGWGSKWAKNCHVLFEWLASNNITIISKSVLSLIFNMVGKIILTDHRPPEVQPDSNAK